MTFIADDRAYHVGYQARKAGKPIADVPYADEPWRRSWILGWEEIDKFPKKPKGPVIYSEERGIPYASAIVILSIALAGILLMAIFL